MNWSRAQSGVPAISGRFCPQSHTVLTVLFLVLISLLLHACAPPVAAPVISREAGARSQHYPYTPAPVPAGPGYYRIRRGDTIYSIAWRYGLDYREFAAWNHIRSPYQIHPGQYLRVVGPTASSRTAESSAVTRQAQENKSQLAIVPERKKAPEGRAASTTESHSSLKLNWQWPTNGKVRTTFEKGDHSRKGVVLSGRLGQGITAAESGTVVYSGSGLIGYGKLIIIKHNKNYLSAYGHNQKLLVKEGDRVKKGTHIADMGKNGSGNVVLHFEIRRNGVPVDPLSLLPRKS